MYQIFLQKVFQCFFATTSIVCIIHFYTSETNVSCSQNPINKNLETTSDAVCNGNN